MKLAALFVAFAVVLLADQCHGLYYKTRDYYGASAPSKLQKPYTEMAKVVILLPTMTEECDVSSCRRVVKSIQKNDMENRNMPDLAENFVVGGCTGIFPGCGWDCVSPMSEKYRRPSVSIAVAGTYSDIKVKPHVANTVKGLIQDGIKKGKIDPNFQFEFSNENGPSPPKFKDTMKELMPEVEDYIDYQIPAE